MVKDGVVYFVQGDVTKRIKIGFTSGRIWDRIDALQTGSPEKLILLREILATPLFESHLHKLFARHRLHGEWFTNHDDILYFIDNYSRPDGSVPIKKWEAIEEIPLAVLRRSLYGCPSDL
jgi:hypothetical protein